MAFSDAYSFSDTVQILPVRTPTLPPATHTNVIRLGSGDALLVEPASPFDDEIERVARWVEHGQAEGLRFLAIMVTHHHADHAGGAERLRRRLELPLWGHEATAERLRGKVQFDATLEEGQRLELSGPVPTTVTVIHTPGHAPGHLCFLDEHSGAMVAGDMVASVGTILIEPSDGDMQQYLESLQRMRELQPAVLLPAHGDPILEPDARLRHYIAHRKLREERIAEALTQHRGPAHVDELVPLAYADTPKRAWPLAALSTEAHLLKLAREGRAQQTERGWVPLAG